MNFCSGRSICFSIGSSLHVDYFDPAPARRFLSMSQKKDIHGYLRGDPASFIFTT